MPLVTVFTPSYNRVHLLENLYHSLLRQTNKNFEWIIVDDGSTDQTGQVVKNWISVNNGFDIKYIFKKNQGKHCAINVGVENASAILFFIVDSDDYLTDDAIERVIEYEHKLPQGKFAGIAFNKGYESNKIVGATFKGSYIDGTSFQRRKNKIFGDKAEIFYTEILLEFPFPHFKNENFLQETVVWYRIAAAGYKLRWFNDIIYICKYLPDGLTANRDKYINNFEGYTCAVKEAISFELPLIDKFIQCGVYAYTAKGKNISLYSAAKNINANIIFLTGAYWAYRIKKFQR